MQESLNKEPTFNLWTEAWISLERPDGNIATHGLEQTLLHAQDYISIYEPSPLVVVGIHRLLVAILQFAINPRNKADLLKIWRGGRFPADVIESFGKTYAYRFDLFSNEPFLQSADLPLHPEKEIKSVVYLAPEIPAGTAITHYRHGSEDTQVFCPACTARGLVCIPAFSTAGGAGIKPSINGVPPIYILPGGKSLFESLAASMLRSAYQPKMASRLRDDVWWVRQPMVGKSSEVDEVGYLHSLTFPARRVRLHPERLGARCTRCGTISEWGIRSMIFEMGESRPKGAEFWFDPFAAYRIQKDKTPTPIRPVQGRATWREFAALFLQEPPDENENRTMRPTVLGQIAELELDLDQPTYPFRCVGLRTDMKAKVFEWIDAGFDVPPAMLRDESAGVEVRQAVDFAADCAGIITRTFRQMFGGSSKKSERHKVVKLRMGNVYWMALADPFRQFVLHAADIDQRGAARRIWAETVVKVARASFNNAADILGDDAETLRQRAIGERQCNFRLAKQRKEYLNE